MSTHLRPFCAGLRLSRYHFCLFFDSVLVLCLPAAGNRSKYLSRQKELSAYRGQKYNTAAAAQQAKQAKARRSWAFGWSPNAEADATHSISKLLKAVEERRM